MAPLSYPDGSILGGQVESRVGVEVGLVDLDLFVSEQLLHDLRPPVLGRQMEGRVVVVVACVKQEK